MITDTAKDERELRIYLKSALETIERELGVRFAHPDWYRALGLPVPAELEGP